MAEIADALERLFKANVRGPWLGREHYEPTATWVKVVFWKPGDSALATILRCYDFMPELAAVRPPARGPSWLIVPRNLAARVDPKCAQMVPRTFITTTPLVEFGRREFPFVKQVLSCSTGRGTAADLKSRQGRF